MLVNATRIDADALHEYIVVGIAFTACAAISVDIVGTFLAFAHKRVRIELLIRTTAVTLRLSADVDFGSWLAARTLALPEVVVGVSA